MVRQVSDLPCGCTPDFAAPEMMLLCKEKLMRAKQVVLFIVVCIALCWITAGKAQVPGQKAPARLYNTAKQKLMEGKQIVGATVFSADLNIYCAMANAGYDREYHHLRQFGV
jgi:hypothetical protein